MTDRPSLARKLRIAVSCSLLSAGALAGCSEAADDVPSGSAGTAPISGASSGGASTTAAGAGGSAAGQTGTSGAGTGGTLGGAGGTGSGGNAGSSGSAGAGGAAAGSGAGGSSAGSAGAAGTAGTGGAGPGRTPTFHLFMLMGQSNMAGVAAAQASDKNTDERLKMWGGCKHPAGQWNLANPPMSDCPGGSGLNLSTAVDPGTWFAKTMLKKLPEGDTIGLIGTAESGEKIETFLMGGKHYNQIMTKIAGAKNAPNARFAGVIFHQGESNNMDGSWPGKVKQLYNQVKQGFGVDYDVPFILGELPAGGCCSGHNQRVHEAAMQLPMGAYVSQQGTKVMDEYHFDHDSVVLMGTRYGDKMLEMLKW